MEPPLIYARMTENNIPQVMALQEACKLSPWTQQAYREALTQPDSIMLTAKYGDSVVGFLVSRLITRENLSEIYNICIDFNFRRKLIGARLLSELFSLLSPEILRVWLEVREGNAPARTFYEKHGFKEVGMRKDFYRDPVEDAILMQKDIE